MGPFCHPLKNVEYFWLVLWGFLLDIPTYSTCIVKLYCASSVLNSSARFIAGEQKTIMGNVISIV